MSVSKIPRALFLDQSGVMGGAELSLEGLAIARKRLGFSDGVLLFESGPFAHRLRAAGIDTRTLPLGLTVKKNSGLIRQIGAAGSVVSVARQVAKLSSGYDLLYANTQKAAVLGAIAGRLANKPVVWHLRDILDAEHFSTTSRIVATKSANWGVKQVIANSQATARAFHAAGGRVPTTVIYNGIDTAPFDTIPNAEASGLGETLGLPPNTPVVGVFGRLTEWKGQHILLEALTDPRLSEVQAVVVGAALFTKEDQRYAESLNRQSRQQSLAGRVHCLGQRGDVPALMRSCDIVAHCSVQPEPFGRVLVEGMMAARPVIATADGGAREIIEDGVNGFLTPPGDASALAAAIRSLLDNPLMAQRIAERGRESATRRFRLEDRVREIDQVISEVCDPGRG